MTSPLLLYVLPGAQHLAASLSEALGAELGKIEIRRFPDGESHLRFMTSPAGRDIAFMDCLKDPDAKLIPLLFASQTARELGAHSVGLVAPYMPYIRQDAEFSPGESVSARHIGTLFSTHFSWLATVDPHLHRLSSLDEILTIPSAIAHAANAMASWIRHNISEPFLLGPDAESRQWVSAIADACQAPFAIFEKTRFGDHEVTIDVPDDLDFRRHTPVIIDDIVSSGGTLATLVSALHDKTDRAPVCCIVHGIFSDGARERLEKAGAGRLVSTNTIPHATNAIDITVPLAEAVRNLSG